MNEYWNSRYSHEDKIWGESPSKTAEYALELFLKNDVKKILILGAGYGRNSKLFSENNFNVTGIEISEKAYKLAQDYDSKTKLFNGSVLNMPFSEDMYDALYCFNTLHLFLRKERFLFLEKCFNKLKNNGFVFFVVFSDKEKSFGKGKEIEDYSFESKLGRPVHYFTEEDLLDHFKRFTVLETGIVEDKEDHGEKGPHIHVLRYIFAKKK